MSADPFSLPRRPRGLLRVGVHRQELPHAVQPRLVQSAGHPPLRATAGPAPERERGENAAAKRQTRADDLARNGVEGKFGNAKHKGTLGRVMAKLRETSVWVANIALVVLNLDTRLREEFFGLCDLLWAFARLPPTRGRRLFGLHFRFISSLSDTNKKAISDAVKRIFGDLTSAEPQEQTN